MNACNIVHSHRISGFDVTCLRLSSFLHTLSQGPPFPSVSLSLSVALSLSLSLFVTVSSLLLFVSLTSHPPPKVLLATMIRPMPGRLSKIWFPNTTLLFSPRRTAPLVLLRSARSRLKASLFRYQKGYHPGPCNFVKLVCLCKIQIQLRKAADVSLKLNS